MGGYGSTRWNGERTRLDTAGLLKLDVRWLARRGSLAPGAISTLSWTRGDGQPVGDIMTIMDRERPFLTLAYSTRPDGDAAWTRHHYRVWLASSPCHYGGTRDWFSCPHCGARRALLYSAGGIFSCRACHDLAYTSTREDAATSCDRRIRRAADRLGNDENGRRGFLWTMPDKPKGMHWRTYDRLTGMLYQEHELREELFTESAMKIIGRAVRVLGERH